MNVKQIAQRVLELHWDYSVPVNIDDIAHKMGAKVQYLSNLEGGEDISGRFDIINGVPVCSIRNTDAIQRQRFTLAHELGHYALNHGGGFKDNTASFNVRNYDKREIDANRFAVELLMPQFAIDYVIKNKDINTVSELAELFAVSQQAMTYRLKNLGWLPN